ncbi:TPA: hypothetical protein KDY48_004579 [Vibrio parahaemolyticus]|nr:hypothetical protein [Vibrio parahaemolyticus]HBC3383662.1 hypothetical protein [Vibrio parahaemolyticus]HBC3445841.1 hypothetical protein [Vibrio parahaemolyticus]HBC3845867.1 hypothetical protein [Vibrio parahaemolyticus]HBH7861982.1 hypothetical protein [Vibrio parahaemolyticus]
MTNKYKQTRRKAVQLYLYDDEKEYIKSLAEASYNQKKIKNPNVRKLSISSFIFRELEEYSQQKAAQNTDINKLMIHVNDALIIVMNEIHKNKQKYYPDKETFEAETRFHIDQLLISQQDLTLKMAELMIALDNYKPVAPILQYWNYVRLSSLSSVICHSELFDETKREEN